MTTDLKFPLKTSKNYVDVLRRDKEISGQQFCCISFLSPEDIIKDKNLYLFEEFVKSWQFTKAVQKYTQFNNFISFKYNISAELLHKDFEEFIMEEKENLTKDNEIENDYKNFIDYNEERLNKAYNIQNEFQTSTRGVKIRGTYSSEEESKLRCKLLREADPDHNIYVGQVGQWLMWNPDAYKTGNVEYLEEELNQLMHEKLNNETKAKAFFNERIKESRETAIKENMEKAKKSGNKLTQTINEDGNLVSSSSITNRDVMLFSDANGNKKETITLSELREQLFEGDVVVDKNNNHGLTEELKRKLMS